MFSVIPYVLFGLSLGFFSTLCTTDISTERRLKFTWSNSLIFVSSLVAMQVLGHEGYNKEILADFVMSGALSGLFIGTSLFSFTSVQFKKRRA
jgi:hypothetical protein